MIGENVREEIGRLYQGGMSQEDIARRFTEQGTPLTRRSVHAYLMQLKRQGKIEWHGTRKGATPRKKSNGANLVQVVDFETATDILIDALQARKELQKVKAELERMTRGYNNAIETVALLQKKLNEYDQRTQRFRLAQQQGDINLPASGIRGKAELIEDALSYFT